MVRYLVIAKILLSLFMSIKKSVIMMTTKSQQRFQKQNIALYDLTDFFFFFFFYCFKFVILYNILSIHVHVIFIKFNFIYIS